MATKIPAFTYSGQHRAEVKDGYWYIYLLSSGTLAFSYAKSLQACLVGGGGGGSGYLGDPGRGGQGGAMNNALSLQASAGEEYTVVVGMGGAAGEHGEASSAFGKRAAGGEAGGGGAIAAPGADGAYAFGDRSLSRYGGAGGGGGKGGDQGSGIYVSGGAGGAGGGGSGAQGRYFDHTGGQNAEPGEENTGGGGGGKGGSHNWQDEHGYQSAAGGLAAAGGSGVVILRGTQDDELPVYFNGRQLSEVYFNGEKLAGLIYGGTRIFAERVRAWLLRLPAARSGFRRAIPAL